MSKKMSLFNQSASNMAVFQMESIASDLVFLLKHAKINRTELAKKLGCDKSRITRVLSGDENLTIKTISDIAEVLGYDFDVVFFNKHYQQPKQPWQIDRENTQHTAVAKQPEQTRYNLLFQTGEEVVKDVLAGNEASHYLKVEAEIHVTHSHTQVFNLPTENASTANIYRKELINV